MNLFETTQLAKLENYTDEDGVIDFEALKNAEIALQDKRDAVLAYIKNVKLNINMIKAAEDDLKDKRRRMENKDESLREFLKFHMKDFGIKSIKSSDGLFSATLSIDATEKVVLEEGAEFPLSLCNEPKKPEPSKTLIKAAIKAGEAVHGAMIVLEDRLTIK